MDDPLLPQTAEEYVMLVTQFAAITDRAMDYLERNGPIPLASLDRIAQNVETIAGLRGDSGIYASTRPDGLSRYQADMYQVEDKLRARLIALGYKYPVPRALNDVA